MMHRVFAPVEILLPSLQHKHPVVIYDSKRYPGRSSEWFYHKLNRRTETLVYRCVRCKSVNEKSKRSGSGSLGVPARIYIYNNQFITDPDIPIGQHICNFESNPETLTSNVYAKRAILEAHMDMRENPERPMAKYAKMLALFDDDNSRYAHLDKSVKREAQTILNQVGSGFNARKRGLMINFQVGKRRKQLEEEGHTFDDAELVVETLGHVESEMGGDIKPEVPEPSTNVDIMTVDDSAPTPTTASSAPRTRSTTAALRLTLAPSTMASLPAMPSSKTTEATPEAVAAAAARSNAAAASSSSSSTDRKTGAFLCGAKNCTSVFKVPASRTRHRSRVHPQLVFMDTVDDIYVYRKLLESCNVDSTHVTNDLQLPTALPNYGISDLGSVDVDYADYTQTERFVSNAQNMMAYLSTIASNMTMMPELQDEFCSDFQALLQKYAHHFDIDPSEFSIIGPAPVAASDANTSVLEMSADEEENDDAVAVDEVPTENAADTVVPA